MRGGAIRKNKGIKHGTRMNIRLRDFPGGPVVKNPPSDAGDGGSIPDGRTKVPHAVGQLSPHATARETSTRHNKGSVQPKNKIKMNRMLRNTAPAAQAQL